jgi:hypothetical protein
MGFRPVGLPLDRSVAGCRFTVLHSSYKLILKLLLVIIVWHRLCRTCRVATWIATINVVFLLFCFSAFFALTVAIKCQLWVLNQFYWFFFSFFYHMQFYIKCEVQRWNQYQPIRSRLTLPDQTVLIVLQHISAYPINLILVAKRF